MLDKICSFRLSVCFLESLINFINGLGIKTMVGILYIWYGGIAESRQGTFTMLFIFDELWCTFAELLHNAWWECRWVDGYWCMDGQWGTFGTWWSSIQSSDPRKRLGSGSFHGSFLPEPLMMMMTRHSIPWILKLWYIYITYKLWSWKIRVKY